MTATRASADDENAMVLSSAFSACRESSRVCCTTMGLEHEGYEVCVAPAAADALKLVASNRVDLILLDLMLPDMSGLEVLRRARACSSVPILVVSARVEEIDKVTAFRLGADDYVTKPFSVLELLERTKALLRRSQQEQPFFDLDVDPAKREVTVRGRGVSLTPIEFDLLCALVRAAGRVLSKQELLSIVWHAPGDLCTRTVEFHVGNLRRKLVAAGLDPCVQVHRGRGFALAADRRARLRER
jgi:DNA-binding response OmpR family regulator